MQIHPDDVRWACRLITERGTGERPFVPTPDTPSTRALADELLALPIDAFLLRLQRLRAKHWIGPRFRVVRDGDAE